MNTRGFSWVVLTADWSEPARLAIEELRRGLDRDQRLKLHADIRFVSLEEHPEFHQDAQTLLQVQGIKPSWPMHLFLTPQRRAFFASPSLPVSDLLKLARDFFALSLLDPERVVQQAETIFFQAQSKDPVGKALQTFVVRERRVFQENDLIRLGVTPIEASLDFETGWLGHDWSWPAAQAYRLLLWAGAQAEAPLVRLARSKLNDVIGGGFFRGFDAQTQTLCTEKLLIDTTQMLEVYLEASQIYPGTPFFKQIAVDLYQQLRDEFWTGSGFAAALSAEDDFYKFSSRDLMAVIEPAHRAWVQQFFGLGLEPTVPSLKSSVAGLSDSFLAQPVDVQNALASARRALKECRRARAAPRPVGYSLRAECEALRVALKFAKSEAWAEQQVREWVETLLPKLDRLLNKASNKQSKGLTNSLESPSTGDRPFAMRALVAVERYAPDLRSRWAGATQSVDPEIWWESPLLGSRLLLMDSMGMSPVAAALNLKLDLGEQIDVDAWAQHSSALGVHAAGVLGACLRAKLTMDVEAESSLVPARSSERAKGLLEPELKL